MFCAPSLHGESFGVVLIEAMAAGTLHRRQRARRLPQRGHRRRRRAAGRSRATPTRWPRRCSGCSPTTTWRARLVAAGRPPGRRLLDGHAGRSATPRSTASVAPPGRAPAADVAVAADARPVSPAAAPHPYDGPSGAASSAPTRSESLMVWIIVLVVVVLLVLFVIAAYNGLIRGRNQVENAWSQIDVQLKRRIDLIPNLVETVKGYAAHEKSTLEAVINARNAAIAAPGHPGRPGRGRQPAHRRAAPAVRPRRGLPRPQGQPELPGPAGGAHRHRRPGRLRAAVLQRQRAELQQQAAGVPHGALRRAC